MESQNRIAGEAMESQSRIAGEARGDVNVRQNFCKRFVNWLKHKNTDKWLEKMQKMLALVSTVIATMTFQVGLNPPGGVLQANNADEAKSAGEAVLAIRSPNLFYRFQISNTVSFIASLSVCLILISGIPLHNRFQMWLLSIGMIITLSFLALTYLYGMLLVAPSENGLWYNSIQIVTRSILIWMTLVGLIAIFLTVRFLVWLVRRCIKEYKRRMLART